LFGAVQRDEAGAKWAVAVDGGEQVLVVHAVSLSIQAPNRDEEGVLQGHQFANSGALLMFNSM
jgi:hypothetical protein